MHVSAYTQDAPPYTEHAGASSSDMAPTLKLMRRLEYKIRYRVKLRLYGVAIMNGRRGVH